MARIEAASRAGFRACEFHWPYETPAAELRACARQHGMTVLGINTPRGDIGKQESGIAALAGREKEFRELFDSTLEYAVACGANAIHVMAGKVRAEDRLAARVVFESNLRYAVERTERYPLTLLLEPLNPRDNPGYFYSTLGEAAALLDEVRHPKLKLQFDVYHVAITEGDVLAKLAKYLPQIGNVQIAAVPTRVEPDEGEIAYDAVFNELDRLGYRGWVGCEYRPRGNTDAGLLWMKRLGVAQDDTQAQAS